MHSGSGEWVRLVSSETLHPLRLHLLLMARWNPPISNRSIPSPSHHMQKILNMTMSPPRPYPPLAAARYFLGGSYSDVKAASALNAALGCARWEGPVVRAGVSQTGDHSLRCCACPMNSAQHPGITMRAEAF